MFFTKSSSANRPLSILCGALFTLLVLPLAAQEIDIGDIEVQGGRNVISVLIASDQAEMKQVAERAFSGHGGFRVVRDRSAASFIFTFRPASGSGVNIDISSGSPTRSQFQETVTGTSQRNALYRAADLAVAKTTGQPGFFAGRLTFVADGTGAKEVYTSDLFLGEVRKLTSDNADSVGPRWSPDGKTIVYTSYYRRGFPDIFKIDLSTQRRSGFISVRGTNTGARFSPDGGRVAMVLSGSGNPEVYVSNAAGQQIRRLTHTDAVQSSPTWSPDGSRLVFTSDRDGRPQLFTMTASGGSMSRIPTNISGNCTEPDWNPRDSNLIAFTAAVGGRFAVAVYDFSSRKSRFLTQGSGDAIAPCWTNDGRHLVY
ncbi:MAG: biopolymer transporter Tol, partial [Opitutales bacterium]